MSAPHMEFQIVYRCHGCGLKAVMAFPARSFTGQLPDLPPPEEACPRCGAFWWEKEI